MFWRTRYISAHHYLCVFNTSPLGRPYITSSLMISDVTFSVYTPSSKHANHHLYDNFTCDIGFLNNSSPFTSNTEIFWKLAGPPSDASIPNRILNILVPRLSVDWVSNVDRRISPMLLRPLTTRMKMLPLVVRPRGISVKNRRLLLLLKWVLNPEDATFPLVLKLLPWCIPLWSFSSLRFRLAPGQGEGDKQAKIYVAGEAEIRRPSLT